MKALKFKVWDDSRKKMGDVIFLPFSTAYNIKYTDADDRTVVEIDEGDKTIYELSWHAIKTTKSTLYERTQVNKDSKEIYEEVTWTGN